LADLQVEEEEPRREDEDEAPSSPDHATVRIRRSE
jgi:hypothetical protein